MDVVQAMNNSVDDEVNDLFQNAVALLKRTIQLYQIPHLAFSFNAGKDSCALLHLLRASLVDLPIKAGSKGSLHGMRCFMFIQEDEFPEIHAFSKEMDEQYGLHLHYLECPMKSSLDSFSNEYDIKGVILGTRRGDPNSPGQDIFCPTTKDWPPLMRINPILNWSYQNIWSFLRRTRVPYCCLYDQGYTSIGGTKNTRPNSSLLKEDGTFAPAYLLADSRLERVGRQSLISSHSSETSTLTKRAALVIIGDELLSGKVEDMNVVFLCRELRSLGWRVNKAVFVPDEVDSIANEVSVLSHTHDMVITAGGIGPTLDDVTMQAIAKAMKTCLIKHPYLEQLIRDFLKEEVTKAHLKMTEVPQIDVEFIETVDEQGNPSPFPLVQCRNVYILPGVPHYLRNKWRALKEKLQKEQSLPPFYNILFRLKAENETLVVPAMDVVTKELGPTVQIGSYPVTSESDGANLFICLESKVQEDLHKAKELFRQYIAPGIIISEQDGVRKLTHSKLSLQNILKLLN